MMKKVLYFGFIVFLGISVFLFANFKSGKEVAAQSVPNWWKGSPAEYFQLVKNAEKEGKVIHYGSMPDVEQNKIIGPFNKLYPNIKVEHMRASNLENREIILRELKAGKTQIDVLEISSELITTFKELKLVRSYDWVKNFSINPIQPDKENMMVKVGGSLHIIAYNTEKVSPKDVPKTWEDLLDPKWKGKKIGTDTRPKGFNELYVAWGEKKLVDYLQKFAKQDPIFKRGGTAIVEMLGAGEFMIAVSPSYTAILRLIKKGAPVAPIIPPIIGTSFERECVLAPAPHPNAAILFLGWLASYPGGQQFYDQAANGEGMPLPGYNTMQGKLVKNMGQLALFTDEWLPKKQEIDDICVKALGLTK